MGSETELLKPFTYLWWIQVGKKAYLKAENYAWRSYVYDVGNYCIERAEIADKNNK